jgi:hypothetical protein
MEKDKQEYVSELESNQIKIHALKDQLEIKIAEIISLEHQLSLKEVNQREEFTYLRLQVAKKTEEVV